MSWLSEQDFPRFFRAIYGSEPFAWQTRLVRSILTEGRWPEVLALPTGSGKTSALDIAVFTLAADASRQESRRFPVRIALVVDRRLIVDSSFERACQLRDALKTCDDPVVQRVRDSLCALSGGDEPLHVARLRGGAPREGDWTPSPVHPTIVVSTVDQVGSRLLFRGYGVSKSMRPVHAGLLGEDTLLLLDEVHLSEPFRQTLTAVRRWRRAETSPWCVAELSATPRSRAMRVFELDEHDRTDTILARRIDAAKPVRLELIRVDGPETHSELLAERAKDLSVLGDGAARTVLVVVNRVDVARRLHRALRRKVADAEVDVMLLIGRARDVDKDKARDSILERVRSGATPTEAQKPFFLVATQTVEAGADLDFDALVTQIAPLDALRQRFGRLNRLGRPIRAAAVIAARAEEVGKRAQADPVYGDRLRPTWDWLNERAVDGEVDFGIAAIDRLLRAAVPGERDILSSPAPDAPVLLPAYLDLWSQTRPTPSSDPEVALFLHGPADAVGEVQVVWRADVPAPGQGEALGSEDVAALLELLPPRVGEAITLPIAAVRRWMRGDAHGAAQVGDTEAAPTSAADEEREQRRSIRGWRWIDAESTVEPVDVATLRPGDTIVVPVAAGGCDEFGWAPEDRNVTDDVADRAAEPFRGRLFSVRLHRDLLHQALRIDRRGGGAEAIRDDVTASDAFRLWRSVSRITRDYTDGHGSERLAEMIERLLGLDLPPSLREALNTAATAVAERRPVMIVQAYGEDDGADDAVSPGVVLYFPRGVGGASRMQENATLESSTEDDDRGSSASNPLSLAQHSNDVSEIAWAYADRLRLPHTIAADVALAAWLHDLGKADERFQRYLNGSRWGDWEMPLAKSARPRTPSAERRAREASGLPDRWRHEALSVRIAREHPKFKDAHDPELVLWLVGTHHGWGRPLFPHGDQLDTVARQIDIGGDAPVDLAPSEGPQSFAFTLSVPLPSGGIREIAWPELFRRLRERYGYWGLARLEALVRLADHRASEEAPTIVEARS